LVPLHNNGLGFVADLVEPALRVIIEETGYDRSIPYGQPTPFRLIPIFNPITLTTDLIADVPEGIQQALNGGPPPLTPPATENASKMALAVDSPATVDLSKDGTTDPESGPTTSNGADLTLPQTKLATASGANKTTNEEVSTTPKLFDTSLFRLSAFAKPNEGITVPGTGGTATDGPLRNALGDFHPVRDVVNAVSTAVKTAVDQVSNATTTSSGG
jgi:hypothetical protein